MFFLPYSSSAVIKRHEEREVQHLRMSIAAPTPLSSFTFPSSLMAEMQPIRMTMTIQMMARKVTRLERTRIETTQVAY
jgi:hypothetical protein